jgi:hypothetical protein
MFGNALPLHLKFLVILKQRGFARRRLPNAPHDNSSNPVAMVGGWEAEYNSRTRYE